MKNITITLRQDVANWPCVEAAKADLSMSAYVSQVLETQMGRGAEQIDALEHFLSGAVIGGMRVMSPFTAEFPAKLSA